MNEMDTFKQPKISIKEFTVLLNELGLCEGIRILQEQKILSFPDDIQTDGQTRNSSNHQTSPKLWRKDWLVLPYTWHLCHRFIEVIEEEKEHPSFTITTPTLSLLRYMPDYFRAFWERYEREPLGSPQKAFALFITEFLNAELYRIGIKGWREISSLFHPISPGALQKNPMLNVLGSLSIKVKELEAMSKIYCFDSEGIAEVILMLPMMSLGGVNQGRLQWGWKEILSRMWPRVDFQLQCSKLKKRWASLHPCTINVLGQKSAKLGENYYLGDKVEESSTTIIVEIQARENTPLFQALRMDSNQKNKLKSLLEEIGNDFVRSHGLTVELQVINKLSY